MQAIRLDLDKAAGTHPLAALLWLSYYRTPKQIKAATTTTI
jgi:hypothetical protein